MDKNKKQEDISRRLDSMDWATLEQRTGITKDYVMNEHPKQAERLAYGGSTAMIPFDKDGIRGEVSLRAVLPPKPEEGEEPGLKPIEARGRSEMKTTKNCFLEDGKPNPEVAYFRIPGTAERQPITSERGLKNLVELYREGPNRTNHYANANAGIPIKSKDTGYEYIVSLNKWTNEFEGVSKMSVERYLKNFENVMGAKLTDDDKKRLASGEYRIIDVKDKEGNSTKKAIQFDAARMEIVETNPKALREIMSRSQNAVQEKSQVEAQENKKETKKGKKPVQEVKEPAKKETKGKKMKVN